MSPFTWACSCRLSREKPSSPLRCDRTPPEKDVRNALSPLSSLPGGNGPHVGCFLLCRQKIHSPPLCGRESFPIGWQTPVKSPGALLSGSRGKPSPSVEQLSRWESARPCRRHGAHGQLQSQGQPNGQEPCLGDDKVLPPQPLHG